MMSPQDEVYKAVLANQHICEPPPWTILWWTSSFALCWSIESGNSLPSWVLTLMFHQMTGPKVLFKILYVTYSVRRGDNRIIKRCWCSFLGQIPVR